MDAKIYENIAFEYKSISHDNFCLSNRQITLFFIGIHAVCRKRADGLWSSHKEKK